ncbi:MAG: peptidoglycan-binding domain-containing protein [Brevundimonas sp.]
MTIRDTIIATALDVQDYRAAIDEAQFRDLLGSPPLGSRWSLDVPFSCKLVNGKYQTKGTSTCGLVSAGILRRAGMPLPWNGSPYWQSPAPYTGLDIVSEFSRLGQVAKCARPAGAMPVPGDVVCIGQGLATHVLTVVDWDGSTMISVDGGQIDNAANRYLQRVKVCRRSWPRKLVWCLDVDRMLAALTSSQPVVDPWTVADTQRALVRLGYDPGPVDGIAGPRTRAAIVAFQRAHGLTPYGVVGPLTRAKLQAS